MMIGSTIQYYSSVKDTVGTEIKLKCIINQIRSSKYKKHTDHLRQETNKDIRKKYKTTNLKAVIFQGTFKSRSMNNLTKHSGLATVDIDDIPKSKSLEIKKEIIKKQYVYSAFLSPSGGLKVLINIPIVKTDDEYKQYYYAIEKEFASLGIKTDPANKDISRLCFLSHDPDIYVNEKTKLFKNKCNAPPTLVTNINSDNVPQKDNTRSAEEIREVMRLIGKNKSKEEIFEHIKDSPKWSESSQKYKDKTYLKALKFCSKSSLKTNQHNPTQPKEKFFGITNFNNATNIFINKDGEIYNHQENIIQNKNESYKTIYTIYEGKRGQGNRPVIIKTNCILNKGDNDVYLKSLEVETINDMLWHMKGWGFNDLCKALRINTKDSKNQQRPKKEIIQDLINLDGIFYEPSLAIDKEEIKKTGNPLDTCLKILKHNTTQLDDDLVYFYASGIPEVEPSSIQPQYYMPYADHSIIITNGGVGKSTFAFKSSGEVGFEKASVAGLLGFADANNKNEGALHNRTKHSYIEEVQEEQEEEIYGKLHTLMEQGQTNVTRGLRISVKSWSGTTFQGNPKRKDDKQDNMLTSFLVTKEFIDFLNKISSNCEPFSRRIGLTFFDKNTKTLVGTGRENEEKGVQIIRTIAEGFKKEFTQLFDVKEILNWLNAEFEDDYKDLINSFVSQSTSDRVADYFKGQINSFRHCKGIALRLAWLDVGLECVWKNGEVNTVELLDSAGEHLQKILKRNVLSFTNIISQLNSDAYDEILKYNVKNIKPEYVKLAVYSLFEWVINNPQNTDKIIPFVEIENHYNQVKEHTQIDNNNRYRSFSRIKESFDKYNINTSLIEDFGLDYDNQNQCFILLNKDKVKKYSTFYRDTKDTKDTRNNNKEKNTETQTSQTSQKEEKSDDSVTFVTCDPVLLRKTILEAITNLDKGDGVDFDNLIDYTGLKIDPLTETISELSKSGRIHETRAKKWKVLQ